MPTRIEEQFHRFDPSLPLEQARTIPASWYSHAEVHDAERHAVFGNTWQAVGRADQVAEPGSYFTADVAGEPIAVVRDGDGTLRAFSNVCRHRGARVLCEEQGRATKMRCRYHGWTYDLTGRLRGTPEFDGVAGFCRESNGLPPLAVAEWGPIVWAHLGPNPPPLVEQIGPLMERSAGLGVERLRFVGRKEYVLACNWKVFVDNFLDGGYHVNTIHPGLAGVIDYSRYRTDVFGLSSVQVSPLTAKSDSDPAVQSVRAGDSAYYWWVFPNFMLNLYQGVMDTNLVLPLSPTSCRVVFDFYFADTEGESARAFIARSLEVAHQVQQEDVGVCEEVQRGLASRWYDTGRFSVKREAGGYHFHQLLARWLQAR